MGKIKIIQKYDNSTTTTVAKNGDLSAIVSTPVPKSEQDIWTLEKEYGEKMKNADNPQDKAYYERIRVLLKYAANYSSLNSQHIENGVAKFNIEFSDDFIMDDFLNYMNSISVNAIRDKELSVIVSTPVPKSEQDIWTLEKEYGEKMKNADNPQDKAYYERIRVLLKYAANYSSLNSQHIENGVAKFNIEFSDDFIMDDFLTFVKNTDWNKVGFNINKTR